MCARQTTTKQMTMLSRYFGIAAFLVLQASTRAWPQATGDTCNNAEVFTGLGTRLFNTDQATTSGFDGSGACGPGLIAAYQDHFFQWTAPSTGDFVVDTNHSEFDTVLSVYSGTQCSATCILQDDNDGIGSASLVSLQGINLGDTFLFQVGGVGSESGLGRLNISLLLAPCVSSPDDCFEDNDNYGQSPLLLPGRYHGLAASGFDPDYYSISIPPETTLEMWIEETDPILWVLDPNTANAWQPLEQTSDSRGWQLENSGTGALPAIFGFTIIPQAPQNILINYDLSLFERPYDCAASGEDYLEQNDTCSTPRSLPEGVYLNLFVSLQDRDFYSVNIPSDHFLSVDLLQNLYPIDFDVYNSNCSFLWTSLGDWNYHNQSGAQETLIFEVDRITATPEPCTSYEFALDIFQNPCPNGFDDPFEENDTCGSAAPIGNGYFPGLAVRQSDPDFFVACLAQGQTITVTTLFSSAESNLDLFLWRADANYCGIQGVGNPLAASETLTQDEHVSWTNVSGQNVDVVVEVRNVGGISLCNTYDLIIGGLVDCTGSVVGTFCDPMSPNSTGLSTHLDGSFPGSLGGSGLHLEVSSGPPTQFGYLLVGSASADPGIPIGQGRLCITSSGGAPIGRYNITGDLRDSIGQFAANGFWVSQSGNSSVGTGFDVPVELPLPNYQTIHVGETWHFQLWHRENGGNSNFSNGLSVAF